MAALSRLYGTDLIDCARANETKGIEVAAQRYGYRKDLTTFEQELKKAGTEIGVEIRCFTDLGTNQREGEADQGIEIAPDSPTQL